MKKNNRPQEGEKRNGMTHQRRWSRDADGSLRYRGICPFNRTVCKLINAFAPMKAGQKGV